MTSVKLRSNPMTKDSRDALEDNGDGSQLQVKLISLPCNLDDRGFLYQIYGTYDSDLPEIRRVYIVGNPSRGIIRGFHRHEHESKAYFVISGSAKFVVINDVGSKATYTLSFRSPSIRLIPPRPYPGWISLE